ncbi:pinin/SDK/memA/ protein conserved region-domain-containing protein [Aspergillus karnatakaensis]|uniref:pinin family protein n=1 Tax=Aspergillus karnatakaensis TaxID=1810916 RepID=UPI003CCC9BEF
MAEGSLASAVIIPDQDSNPPSPDPGLKRRQSSITDHDPDSKRRRLSTQTNEQSPEQRKDRQTSPPKPGPQESERKRRDEDRKRGQRLFGSLLGTLSQSSNSAAQRRRADIERKQQDKLKLQDEEYGELKKNRREERLAQRKREQKLYERELMHTRHNSLLATAHFLKTKTEPVLYYKPWELRSGDEAIIENQIREAEATIAREVEEFDSRGARDEEQQETKKQDGQNEHLEQSEPQKDGENEAPKEQVDQETNETIHEKGSEQPQPEAAPIADTSISTSTHEDHRAAEDDGGEVVEDNEDTVIY